MVIFGQHCSRGVALHGIQGSQSGVMLGDRMAPRLPSHTYTDHYACATRHVNTGTSKPTDQPVCREGNLSVFISLPSALGSLKFDWHHH